jgi:hypothetical protein
MPVRPKDQNYSASAVDIRKCLLNVVISYNAGSKSSCLFYRMSFIKDIFLINDMFLIKDMSLIKDTYDPLLTTDWSAAQQF